MQPIKKPIPQGVRAGWTITLVSLVVIIFASAGLIVVYRSVGGNNLRSVGTQLALLTLLLAAGLCGLIAGPILTITKRREAREIEEIRAGRNVLAHWTYAPDEWSQYIRQEIVRARKYFYSLVVAITVIVLAVTLSMPSKSSLDGDISALSFSAALILIGVVAFLLWVGLYAPILAARKRGQGDVYISPRGVLLNDRYYSWAGLYASGSPKVSFVAGDPPIIQFDWTIGGRRDKNVREVRLPVPRGHEQEVQDLLTYFKG
jgi:hypothetical protein